MTLTILGIVATVVTFVLWLARKRIEEKTPQQDYLKELEKNDKILSERNEDKINRTIDDALRDINSRGVLDAGENNSGGQGSKKHDA